MSIYFLKPRNQLNYYDILQALNKWSLIEQYIVYTAIVKEAIQIGKDTELNLLWQFEMPRNYIDRNLAASDFLWVGDYAWF